MCISTSLYMYTYIFHNTYSFVVGFFYSVMLVFHLGCCVYYGSFVFGCMVFHCMNILYFTQSPVGGHLQLVVFSFWLLPTSASVTIPVHVFWLTYVSISVGYIPRSGIVGSDGMRMSSSPR